MKLEETENYIFISKGKKYSNTHMSLICENKT